jgi:hypothetical protein
MSASNSTPRSGEKDDGAQFYEQKLHESIDAQMDLVRDSISFGYRCDGSFEDKLNRVRAAKAQLEIAETLLAEEVSTE